MRPATGPCGALAPSAEAGPPSLVECRVLIRVRLATKDRALQDRLARACAIPHVLVSAHAADDGDERLAQGDYDIAIVDGPGPPASVMAALDARPSPPTIIVAAPLDASIIANQSDVPVLRLDATLDDDGLSTAVASLVRAQRDQLERAGAVARRKPGPPDVFISSSPKMLALLDVLRRVANSESSVLLLGETGSGKERLASLLHQQSARRRGPFVAINCAAIPHELFESELFGHRRGAFTGATRDHRGVFEQARGGTLFLDEIAELPLSLQPKLLRVLQEQQLRPVGSDRGVATDVRVVSAANRNLKADADAGRFRADLYYRLGVIELTVPPLRARKEDVWPLAQAWLAHFQARLSREDLSLDPALREVLERHAWPGNVRELVNVMERAVLLAQGSVIGLGDVPDSILAGPTASSGDPATPAPADPTPTPTQSLAVGIGATVELPEGASNRTWREVRDDVLLAAERAYLTEILEVSQGRVGHAARLAGMSERSLFEKMRRHDLNKEDFR